MGSWPSRSGCRSVGDDLVAVGDERPDARVTVVVVEGDQPRVLDRRIGPEGPGAVLADADVVLHRAVEVVVVVLGVLELLDPLGARPVEDDLDLVTRLDELACGLEAGDQFGRGSRARPYPPESRLLLSSLRPLLRPPDKDASVVRGRDRTPKARRSSVSGGRGPGRAG